MLKFARLDPWLTVTGPLSKTALTFAGLALLLTFISFNKGIQVLMFIPAFMLGMFVYSYFDVRRARRVITVSWLHEKKLALRINYNEPREFCTYFLAYVDKDGPRILTPQKNLTFVVPKTHGQFLLLVQGRLDIFRRVIPLPDPPEEATASNSGESDEGEIYFSLQEYEEGDELKRIDALQSAKRQKWFVRKTIHEPPVRRPGTHALPKVLSLVSNQFLKRREDVQRGRVIEWSLIAIAVLAAHLEWRNWIFTGLALGSIGFVHLWINVLRWRQPGRFWMNTTALLLFIGCFIEGGIIRDTVPAGTHFLILLSIWKHLFIRERRDAFTYVFLVLFVFVALSLYTLNAWFIFLFFLFLVLSVNMFSYYSAGELPEEYMRAIESPAPRFGRMKISAIVLVSTIALFFVLPHGDRSKDTSLLEGEIQTQTGFDEEVELSEVRSIMRDYSKRLVIENGSGDQVEQYAALYWRGTRFDRFQENKWTKPELRPEAFSGLKGFDGPSENWEVRMYHENGSDTIFTPVAPVDIENPSYRRVVFNTSGGDTTLYEFTDPQYNDIVLELEFATDAERRLIPAQAPTNPYRPPDLSEETIALFQPFWDSLPPELADDPQALSDYIMRRAGFRYALRETAPSLESFLYEDRRGHCEYFATVLAVTLQHFGYPATYVNGYTGGEWNPRGEIWVVRGVNAHSWVEVFDAETGWLRLDPTPPSDETFFPGRTQGWQLEFYQIYDWIELRWFEFFVSYTGQQQRALLLQIFVHRRLIFWSLVAFFLYRKLGRPLIRWSIVTWRRTPAEHFLWWLKRRTKGDTFILRPLQPEHPELVAKTRGIIFGKQANPQELRQLKREWRRALWRRK